MARAWLAAVAIPAWWTNRAPRERMVLAAGLVVLGALVFYAFVWQPAADGVRRVEADLPGLRTQTADVLAMAEEAGRLRAAGGQTVALTPDTRMAAVRRSLERAGLLRDAAAPETPAAGQANAPVTSLSIGADAVPLLGVAATSKRAPAELSSESGGRIRVRFADIDYGVWVGWLAATEAELGARAARAAVAALGPAAPVGHVRADVVFEWAAATTPSAGAKS